MKTLSKLKKIFSRILVSTMVFGVIALPPQVAEPFLAGETKFCSELIEVLEKSNNDDLIPVWIFRDVVRLDEISDILYEETGMRADVYQTPEVFESYVNNAALRELNLAGSNYNVLLFDTKIASVVARHFEETAIFHRNAQDYFHFGTTGKQPFNSEAVQDIVRAAAAELADEFYVERIAVTGREVEKINSDFAKHIPASREVLYSGIFTGTHILRATPLEIQKYAALPEVTNISFYDESLVAEPERLDWALSQTGVKFTKGELHPPPSILKGNGIRIGVLETPNRVNLQHAHLSNANLSWVPHPTFPIAAPPANETTHATFVTSIIVGQAVTINGIRAEGVVPNATAYQTIFDGSNADMYNRMNLLAQTYVVHVINCSFGAITGLGYNVYDLEADKFIRNTGVTIVKSAGNQGNQTGEISSPGKALNVITVGNADTISGTNSATQTQRPTPFGMNSSSSFAQADYLPNKPDIVAPGTNIFISNAAGNGFYNDLGPSIEMTGTSISAPIVTGIVAQHMQYRPALISNNTMLRATLYLSANPHAISTVNNSNDTGNAHLRQRSGIGLARADVVYWAYTGSSYNAKNTTNWVTAHSNISINSGQGIRAVLVFSKSGDYNINSTVDMDEVAFRLVNQATGQVVAISDSSKNNVEVIRFVTSASGVFRIEYRVYRVRNTTNGVNFSIVYDGI